MSWYDLKKTSSHNSVISSRIRLARNIKGIPFPSKMDDVARIDVNRKIELALKNSKLPIAKALKFIKMEDVPENERMCMVERHIISPAFAQNYKNRAIILSEDETVSIMIGEEDHIRIQVILPGLQLEKAYEIADLADDMLCSALDIAYDKRLGFLTECPTNIGTGMRASVMMHLPLVSNTGELKNFSDSASKIGYTVRGMYGEGSESAAPVFQISNQITLGLGEKNAIDNLNVIVQKLALRESKIAEGIGELKLEDIRMRALGTLKYARILSSTEMMKQISRLCVGGTKDLPYGDFNAVKLFVEGQPHTLMKLYGDMSPDERDIKRAKMFRDALKKY